MLRGREPNAEAIEDLVKTYLKSDLFVAARKRKRKDTGNFKIWEWRQSVKVCGVDVEREKKVSWC
jgi:hypothetical protein